jgi:hypothetical protein
MQQAMVMVRDNGMSVRLAAQRHDVPRQTLSAKVRRTTPTDRIQCLTSEEERSLAGYATYCAERCFPLTGVYVTLFGSLDNTSYLPLAHLSFLYIT